MLLPAPPDVVPYITAYRAESLLPCPLVRRADGPGVGYADERGEDRDSFGTLWVRVREGEGRLGQPLPEVAHPLRQRRAMDDMRCRVCGRPPADPGGPYLFLLRGGCGPVREGERTAVPPVCVPCAAIVGRSCRAPWGGRWAAAWVTCAPVWGVYGTVHHPVGLGPVPGLGPRPVAYDSALAPLTVARRTVVELHGVVPADLEREWAALGRDRLEAEFARVAEAYGTRPGTAVPVDRPPPSAPASLSPAPPPGAGGSSPARPT